MIFYYGGYYKIIVYKNYVGVIMYFFIMGVIIKLLYIKIMYGFDVMKKIFRAFWIA